MNLSDMQREIEQLKREKWDYAKREETRREVDAVMCRMDGLEHSVGEIRAECDGLRSRIEELEAGKVGLEVLANEPSK